MTLHGELYSWLAQRPLWQQALARELTKHPTLQPEEYERFLDIILHAHGTTTSSDQTSQTPPPESLDPVAPDDLPGGSGSTHARRLHALSNLVNVGALAPDQVLPFSPDGLTVVYGPNASGKSTYVRALKKLTTTVDLEDVLRPNVFLSEESQGEPQATVHYSDESNADVEETAVNLEDEDERILESLSVFDARCAELYVTSVNKIAYVPTEVKLLTRLANTQDRMRHRIRELQSTTQAGMPIFDEFRRDTVVGTALSSLTSATEKVEIYQLAQIGEGQRARHAELKAALAAADSTQSRHDAQAARQDATSARSLAASIRQLLDKLVPEAISNLRSRLADHEEAQEAVRVASAEFTELSVPHVGSTPWRTMWDAAREYVVSYLDRFPPQVGESCPLCHQELSEEAAERLRHFEDHVAGHVQGRAQQAEQRLEELRGAYDPKVVRSLRDPFLEGLRNREPDLHTYLSQALSDLEAVFEHVFNDPRQEVEVPEIDLSGVDAWVNGRDEHAETLEETADPQSRAGVAEEFYELDDRIKLESRLEDIDQAIDGHLRMERLEQVLSSLSTGGISRKEGELAELAVTEVLDKKLTEELGHLRCDHIPVELSSEVRLAESRVGLILSGTQTESNVSDILSEGEERAVGLAFYFAELATAQEEGGIIVDDPVSSLDDERRQYIAERLALESEVRQVIVFTHDLPFMLELTNEAEERGAPAKVVGMWRLEDRVGNVDERPPFPAMKFRDRVKRLKDRVQEWDSQPPPQSFDGAWRRVCDFYNELRKAWERGVEERLFAGVVQRFQREVKTLRLEDVQVDEWCIQAVRDGMGRCGEFVHDSPPGSGARLPRKADVEDDLQALVEFEKVTRK